MTRLNHFVLHLKSKHSVMKEEYKARSKFKNARQRTHTINTNLTIGTVTVSENSAKCTEPFRSTPEVETFCYEGGIRG